MGDNAKRDSEKNEETCKIKEERHYSRTFFGIIGTLPALIIRPFVSKIGVGKTKVVDPGSTIVQDSSNSYSPPTSPPKNLLDN